MNAGLEARYGVDAACAQSLRSYIAEQRAATGVVPDDRTIVIEQFRDEMDALRIILHSLFGGRVNAPWGMALAQRVREALAGRWRCRCRRPTTASCCACRTSGGTGAAVRADASLRGRGGDARDGRGRGDVALRRALSDECGARAAPAARIAAAADAALAAAAQGARSAARPCGAFRPSRFSSRRIATCCRTRSTCRRSRRCSTRSRAGRIAIRTVETERASPFAAWLQFGFVMDWLYGDDTPRAERQAALLSLDRGAARRGDGHRGRRRGDARGDRATARASVAERQRGARRARPTSSRCCSIARAI